MFFSRFRINSVMESWLHVWLEGFLLTKAQRCYTVIREPDLFSSGLLKFYVKPYKNSKKKLINKNAIGQGLLTTLVLLAIINRYACLTKKKQPNNEDYRNARKSSTLQPRLSCSFTCLSFLLLELLSSRPYVCSLSSPGTRLHLHNNASHRPISALCASGRTSSWATNGAHDNSIFGIIITMQLY